MEEDLGDDVLMQDGDATVVESTEPLNHPADAPPETSNATLNLHGRAAASPKPLSPNTPTLKGDGVRREALISADNRLSLRPDDPKPAKWSILPYATSQTGLIYDVRMRFHVESEPTDDDLHPEDPRRIHAIFEAFVNAGLAWQEGVSGPAGDYYMGRIDTRRVTKEEACLVHTEDHWNWVQSLSTLRGVQLIDELQHPPAKNDSIYLSASTPYCAQLSAGGAIEACRAVILGKVKNVFAVIRPPGHHAEREDAKGFCFFDNVSIATKVCQREFGERCRKVFILDWDVHHGNGIQQAHYDDPNVLYISLHVHKRGNFYPETSYRDGRKGYGNQFHCGTRRALGKNVNIPWSKQGMGDADYIYAFQQIVMPIATEFDPDLVIVAAGFDAAEGDLLGGCKVTPAGYAHMTHMLMSLAQGKMAVCLEGGYNLESIARSACAVAKTMMGEPPDRLENIIPTTSAVDDIKEVLRIQSRFWGCLYPKDISIRLKQPIHNGVRMHNVVREWQAETLWNEHEMSPLFIHQEQLATEFENQVLATPKYKEARPLLVILHDPPEVLATPDPRTGRIDLHNTWLTDVVKTYVDWAVKQGFSVIDVNLPKHIADYDANSDQGYREASSVESRVKEATLLLTYLWENHIEIYDATHVFLMGTNIGHGAIVNFIKTHEEQAERLDKAISFVEDVPLLSCKSMTNDNLRGWYYSISLVFVSGEHAFWTSEVGTKSRKRFGNVAKSEQLYIGDMLHGHKEAVFAALIDATEDWDPEKAASEDDIEAPTAEAPRLPPIGNFALSPSSKNLMNSPGKSTFPPPGSNSPYPSGIRSPPKFPPLQSFAPSPKR
ncbi:Histone deacetylase clr3 [Lecanosticta acicola]|uniref:Histone deacetylase n=1 Tax=Lecanosticta acicola TaxID=111012 RepID=A0AAI8YXA4_9PEZI|nr:Histone deacetylase clr3 [Lecanosticta acicola]